MAKHSDNQKSGGETSIEIPQHLRDAYPHIFKSATMDGEKFKEAINGLEEVKIVRDTAFSEEIGLGNPSTGAAAHYLHAIVRHGADDKEGGGARNAHDRKAVATARK